MNLVLHYKKLLKNKPKNDFYFTLKVSFPAGKEKHELLEWFDSLGKNQKNQQKRKQRMMEEREITLVIQITRTGEWQIVGIKQK